ncbi:hypothetical protein JTB14_027603 [Gonioctena quinquepunctata]|nr:hypothetical protein JTB14_027603 [Gonioctena quinquepunctata]
MAGRFTKEEYMLLINTIREFESLYDPQHKDYKCKLVREKSWEAIAGAIGKTVKECRMKWRNLRDHYMRGHLKNGNRHMQWTFYEPLSFLERIRINSQLNGSFPTTGANEEEDDVFSETEENSAKKRKTSYDFSDTTDDRLVVQTVVVQEEIEEEDDGSGEDIDAFMRNIGARLKKLPQHSIDLAKMNILAHVTELELEQSWTLSAMEPYS